MEAVSRRDFVVGSAAFVFASGATVWSPVPAPAAPIAHDDVAFFDQRFETARRIAASWPAPFAAVAVLGDITPWTEMLVHAPRERAMCLRGVTTESFRFCAAVLVAERAEVELQSSRLDRNLVLWTMRTTPKLKAVPRHG